MILHADADAFFAAVAQRDDPALRGRPVCVGGGVVMAASYEARAFGVRGGMGGTKARELCPHAIFVAPDFDAYRTASDQLFDLFREAAPNVEGLSLEEAFMDIGGLEHICGTPREIGARLRRDIREQVGLVVTVGIARSKTLAKMASTAAKPDGLLLIEPGTEIDFLHPLPVDAIWGVGKATARRLHAAGIHHIADISQRSEAEMVAILGRSAGRHLHALSHNRERRRIRSGRPRRSFGAQSAVGRGPHTPEEIDRRLASLVDRVTRRMRKKDAQGRTVVLRLRFGDYAQRATRSRTLPEPTAASRPILETLRDLLAAAQPRIEREGITLVGVTITNLCGRDAGRQLVLLLDDDGIALDAALDAIGERFGADLVVRGVKRPRSVFIDPER